MSGKKDMVDRPCPICGKVYQVDLVRLTRHGRGTTCSRACSYQLRSENKSRQQVLTCGVCGTEFSRTLSHVKGKYGSNFCSRTCHYAGRSSGLSKRVVTRPYRVTEAGRAAWKEGAKKTVAIRRQRDNYVKSEATRAKLSEAVARHLARSQGTFASSKIEGVVARALDALGIGYERQFVFRDPQGRFSAVVDFWLPATRTALEVNGTFWHADPRVYKAGSLCGIQQRAVVKYERKLQTLRELNIPVCEVWEMDLKKEPRQAVLDAYTKIASR